MEVKIIPVLYNVYSQHKVIEFARIAFSLGYNTVIIVNAFSSAAQAGIPEAQKLALKKKKNLFYLSEINDIISIFSLSSKVYLITTQKFSNEPLNIEHIISEAKKDNVFLVFSGSDTGFTRKELDTYPAFFIRHLRDDIGSIGLAAITLYCIYQSLQ